MILNELLPKGKIMTKRRVLNALVSSHNWPVEDIRQWQQILEMRLAQLILETRNHKTGLTSNSLTPQYCVYFILVSIERRLLYLD